MPVSRRQFMGSSAAAVVAGAMASNRAFGANERINVATMGLHGQGHSHMGEFLGLKDHVDIVALCDVDENVLNARVAEVKEKTGKEPKAYTDIRELLENKEVDALSIATPNHWHALAGIWACMAGKDVYVEKPLCHNYYEGKQLIAAAKKYGRIVQHGTQQRSSSTRMRDMQLIANGFIGDVYHSRGYVYKNGNRHSIGYADPKNPPDHLHWDLWQGPAQEKPYCDNFVHYNWHWFWDYGNGENGNQGVHEYDVAVWGMNKLKDDSDITPALPVYVSSTGGRYVWDDQGETPNTQAVQFEYADGKQLTFEVRNIGSFHEGGGGSCGDSVFGSKGYYVRDVGFFGYDNKPIPVSDEEHPRPESWGRMGNFVKAMRSRDWDDIHGNPVEGFISCAHIHLGNIAYRLGRSLNFDPVKEEFVNDPEATAMLTREYRAPFVAPKIA